MIPEHLYITELGILAYGFVYLPVVIIVFLLLWKKLRLPWIVLAPIIATILTLPFWDVYMIGRDADRLCNEQGGLHVYKTVEADGFLGGGSIERWSQYGFSYVESGGMGDKKYRTSIQDGKVLTKEVSEYISRYRLAGENHTPIHNSISRSSLQIVTRKNNEVLGELIYFSIYPGIFDGVLLKLLGSGPVLWQCGNEPQAGRKDTLGYGDVVMAVLKPRHGYGEQK